MPARASKSPPRARPNSTGRAKNATHSDTVEHQSATAVSGSSSGGSTLKRTATQDGSKCIICLEVLINPVTLQCGHSMCLHCCTDYMEHAKDGPPGRLMIKCPTARCEVPPKIPNVNIIMRDQIENTHPERVEERRSNDDIPTPRDLKPRIDAVNFTPMLTRAGDSAKGPSGLFVGMLLVFLLAAFCAGTTSTADASVTGNSGTLGAFLSDVGLEKYSGSNAINVNVLAGRGLQSAADLVGIKTQSEQRLLCASPLL